MTNNHVVTIEDVAAAIEEFAPLSYQAPYDNAGLVVGRPTTPVEGVLLAVDVTPEVIAEAIAIKANLIVTHHPIIFHPLKRLNSRNYVEQCVEQAIRNDIALYACHTNLDSAPQGMSWRLAQMIGLSSLELLEEQSMPQVGFGVVGNVSQPISAPDYLAHIASALSLEAIRYSRPIERPISKVALCTGAGGSLIEQARQSKVDIYITGELKYNDFMEPGNDFMVADIGHFESEYCAIDILFDILSKKILNFAVRKSKASCNPIYYKGFCAR